ncbi:hypothetical protein T492DRAFT_488664 [Pavlovales sp. CCMP2436]|nr:hypothetical protein T492DRAFT_488664 [Pavlovales sp. CCMP2436]
MLLSLVLCCVAGARAAEHTAHRTESWGDYAATPDQLRPVVAAAVRRSEPGLAAGARALHSGYRPESGARAAEHSAYRPESWNDYATTPGQLQPVVAAAARRPRREPGLAAGARAARHSGYRQESGARAVEHSGYRPESWNDYTTTPGQLRPVAAAAVRRPRRQPDQRTPLSQQRQQAVAMAAASNKDSKLKQAPVAAKAAAANTGLQLSESLTVAVLYPYLKTAYLSIEPAEHWFRQAVF